MTDTQPASGLEVLLSDAISLAENGDIRYVSVLVRLARSIGGKYNTERFNHQVGSICSDLGITYRIKSRAKDTPSKNGVTTYIDGRLTDDIQFVINDVQGKLRLVIYFSKMRGYIDSMADIMSIARLPDVYPLGHQQDAGIMVLDLDLAGKRRQFFGLGVSRSYPDVLFDIGNEMSLYRVLKEMKLRWTT